MTQLKKYALLFAIIVCASAKAQEATNSNFSLQQSIEFAIKNSPSYLNAELDMENAEYRRKEIAGLGLPQITGSFDFKDYFNIPVSIVDASKFNSLLPPETYGALSFGLKYNASAGLSASQLLFSSDYIFGLKASKEFINLSRISVTRSKADLVAQVSKAYYNVIINRDRIKLLEANVVRLKKIYEDTKAFNKQGFAELIDVERLEVQYNNLLTEKDKTIKLIGLSETMLKFQMGYKVNDPIVLTDSLNVVTNFEELNISKIDVSKRPDYVLLQAQQNLLDLDVKRLKWGYLPTLAAYGSYQYNTMRTTTNIFETDKSNAMKQWYPIALVGITLNLNIFDGLQRHNKIQQAKISSRKNENSVKMVEQAGELEATVAAISYNNAYSSLLIQKKNLEMASHVYDVVQEKFKQGVGSNSEIINAETSLKEAQTNYYNAVYDMLVYKIDYQKAIGTLVK
ncbi:MAG: TolC family protein [Bacteroidia bacterium]|nr:TolC family protein [Bacteroidia bacterium]